MTIKQDFSDQRFSINYLKCLSDNTKAEIFSWVAVSNISMLYLELLNGCLFRSMIWCFEWNGRNDCPILPPSRGKLYKRNRSNGSKLMVFGKSLLFLQAVASFGYKSCCTSTKILSSQEKCSFTVICLKSTVSDNFYFLFIQ